MLKTSVFLCFGSMSIMTKQHIYFLDPSKDKILERFQFANFFKRKKAAEHILFSYGFEELDTTSSLFNWEKSEFVPFSEIKKAQLYHLHFQICKDT